MVEIKDAVRASQTDNQRMLARSYQTWSSYLKEAQLQDRLQPAAIHLPNILDIVPAYLANTFTQGSWPAQLKLEQQTLKSSNSELFISGWSIWHTSESDCDLRDKIIHYQLLFGTQLSTTCTFADDSRFANWPGIQGEPENLATGNYLAILAFAWAYVLSACWLEIQQDAVALSVSAGRGGMLYLYDQAKWISDCSEVSQDELEIDLGDVDNNAARWWTAILATGEG